MNKYHTTSLLIPIIAICLFFSACNNDDDDSASSNKTDIQLVTGLYARQSPNMQPLTLGNPNVFMDYNKVSVYPIPTINQLSISANYTHEIEKIWLVPAEEDKIYQDEDFNAVFNEYTYKEESISNKAIIQIEDINATDLSVNLEDKAPGYYKVFIKIENTIYWDNIYKVGNNENGDEVFNYWQ
ncbi:MULTISPECIES: hypothetical protein [Mesonia]|uniref:Uncharacterized protein n=1 Tax=Mesonia oceanica TaxID=2687242 RepID=A0AC61Y5E6_9FLAO|nr:MULTISPECIES: hypothetical protein [Mesonia]MAN28976.1 hypothetical protein [Mesonia sp.]MAQ42756.1 hypothetical protein [Mesonia sp.]MBJ99294.1 hypothetical protein [Flavobacteriaceae bacterium]VVU99706.1 hypothetical protein FVB9532_00963 [Mesonia oceanica]|tara:strand:- start:325 stop:876 length:552 start_codon:yes stop_codon:yes gene_type:complete